MMTRVTLCLRGNALVEAHRTTYEGSVSNQHICCIILRHVESRKVQQGWKGAGG
jgi:hypothetical protein